MDVFRGRLSLIGVENWVVAKLLLLHHFIFRRVYFSLRTTQTCLEKAPILL